MAKAKDTALFVDNEKSRTTIGVEKRDMEADITGAPFYRGRSKEGSDKTYLQPYVVVVIGDREIWLLPGEARKLSNMLRS